MSEQYQNDHINETRMPALDIATYICLPTAYISIIFRIVSRRISKVPLKADDWWIFVGLVSGQHLNNATLTWASVDGLAAT